MSSGAASLYYSYSRSGKERKVDNKVPNSELSLANDDRFLISLVSSYIPNKIASCWIDALACQVTMGEIKRLLVVTDMLTCSAC